MLKPDRLTVVLVAPRNPLNIGAAARAMANFGFFHLTAVAPYEPHWREAQSAVGAEDLLQNAKHTERLEEALADCTLVVGTGTLDHRQPEQPVIPLPALAPIIHAELIRGGRIALVFGPEKRGLTRADLARCHLLLTIPTHPRQPSMNLGQAVAVCLYEVATRLATLDPPGSGSAKPNAPSGASNPIPAASSATLDLLAGLLDQLMLAADYSPETMREANRHDLRLLLRRLAFSEPDARRALGFFRRVLHRLEPAPATRPVRPLNNRDPSKRPPVDGREK
jgi:TrmH family RNA methyltransferase